MPPTSQTKPVWERNFKPIETLKRFDGKTIKCIDDTSCNVIHIEFTDGTELVLESEIIHSCGLTGITKHVPK